MGHRVWESNTALDFQDLLRPHHVDATTTVVQRTLNPFNDIILMISLRALTAKIDWYFLMSDCMAGWPPFRCLVWFACIHKLFLFFKVALYHHISHP